MTEEKGKVEEKTQNAPAQAGTAEAPKQEAAKAAPGEAPKARLVGKRARPKNCVQCNKTIKNKWYYRNGKYYCTKRCWKSTLTKQEAPAKAT